MSKNSTESMVARDVAPVSIGIRIGITGLAQSGKDTLADMLAELLPDFVRASFASPIYDMVKAGFGIEFDSDKTLAYGQRKSFRYMLQTLGTEWGRKLISEDIWITALENTIGNKSCIISDIRFENEAKWVRAYGVLVHVRRIDQDLITEADHVSEDGIAGDGEDVFINNKGSLGDLEDAAKSLATFIKDKFLLPVTLTAEETLATPEKELLKKTVSPSDDYIIPTELERNYSDMIERLAKPGDEILKSLTIKQVALWHMATGVAGEAGELLDAVKKHVIYNKPLGYDHIVEELGDLEFYSEGVRQNLGITRTEVLNKNMQKLGKRYEKGYSDKAAQERADKKD